MYLISGLLNWKKFQPTQRVVHATVEIVVIPGLTKGANQGEGVGNKFLAGYPNRMPSFMYSVVLMMIIFLILKDL